MGAGGAPALRVSRAVTRLTVHRSLHNTRAVVYEIKMGTAKNDTVPPKNDRGDHVLLDELEKKSQDTLWHVS